LKINIVSDAFIGQHSELTQNKLFGGAEVYLLNLCRILLRRGYSVTVIQAGADARTYEFEGIRVKEIRVPEYRLLQKMGLTRKFHYFNYFWKSHIDKDADIVHFHYFYNAFPFASGNMSGTSHGIEWDCPDYKMPLRRLSPRNKLVVVRERFHHAILRYYARKSLERLKYIAANDLYFKRYVDSEYPQYRDKVIYIPNAVDTDLFNPSVPPDEEITKKYIGKIKILAPKNMSKARGTHLAFEAVRKIGRDDIVLLCAGNSPPHYVQMSVDLGISNKVVFLGHKDNQREMPGIYAASDIVIVPSTCREATSIAMLEGMAIGKPTIVTNVGGLTDVVIDEFNGKVCDINSDSLAQKIMEFIQHPDEAKRMGNTAQEWVSTRYNLRIWGDRYVDFFNRVAGKVPL